MLNSPEPPESRRAVRLITLGSAKLLADASGDPERVLLRPGKPLALLIYLAATPSRTASREHLVNLLWADAEPERGLRTLRQTVFQLRQLLGDDAIAGQGRDLSLAISLDFDRDAFLAAVTSQSFDRAIELYTGSFLSDFGVPGGAEFEHWADRERDRLQSAYIRAAESVIRSRLDHGQHESASQEARRLRDFDPDRESSWRLLLEALSSSGDRISTIAEVQELEKFLDADDREPEALTRTAIARAKRTQPATIPDEPAHLKLVAELTGRDREFSYLTSSWLYVKAGHFRHVHITAPPGIGKTRLLRDVFTRLRASGARALWISAFAGERQLAYALASDIVEHAGNLSGASGVSTAAASSLVALNPKLSSSFAALPEREEGEEALRRRIHAVKELFEALAEESPIALFIDDMHWADPVSRQLLKSSFSRIDSCRILLVTSSRLVPDGNLHLPATETLTLEPLDEHQVGQLVSSFGSLRDRNIGDAFIHSLHEYTEGSPLLVLENLHLAVDRELLEMRDGVWHFPDPPSLLESISKGGVLEERLQKLDDRSWGILLVLAIAQEPISSAMIAATLKIDPAAVDNDLFALDQHALAASEGGRWSCAHDSIADAVLRMSDQSDRVGMHARIGQALTVDRELDFHKARAAVRHFRAANKQGDADAVFANVVTMARAAGDKRANLQLASSVLGETAPSEAASRLVASLPFRQRFGNWVPLGALSVSSLVLLSTMVPLAMQQPKPAQLSIVTQPIAAAMVVVPAPVIEIEDSRGRRVRGATDTVSVTALTGGPQITGTLSVKAVDGRAEFKDIIVAEARSVQLRFTAHKLRPVNARPINTNGSTPALWLVHGNINNQTVDAKRRTMTVQPGGMITGDLMFRYSSYWAAASVILGAAPTWGDRAKNFVDLSPLFTPAVDEPRRAHIALKAPETAGTYHIIFAFAAEGNVEDFLSGTNWRLPNPIWNDGNDVVDWTPNQLSQANTQGWAQTSFIQIDDRTGKAMVSKHPMAATVIDVVVTR